jgi:hypothetical protein
MKKKKTSDIINAMTPSNLSVMERQITYENRKYSGLMWTGVTGGLAGIKLGTKNGIQGRNIKSGITGNKRGTSKTIEDVNRLCRG